MESSFKAEEACINLANSLILKCHAPVPRVQYISELGSLTFVHLFQCLCSKPLPGIIDFPQSVKDELHNINLLISSLSTEVLNVSLSHLNSKDIVDGNPVAVYNLLEIFMGYFEYVLKTNVNTSINNASSKQDSDVLNQEIYTYSAQFQGAGDCGGQSEGSTADLIQECKDIILENSDCSTSELIKESEEIATKLGINIEKPNMKIQSKHIEDKASERKESLRAGVDDYTQNTYRLHYPASEATIEPLNNDSDSEDSHFFLESDETEEKLDNFKAWPTSRASLTNSKCKAPKVCRRKIYKKMTTTSSSTHVSSNSSSPSNDDNFRNDVQNSCKESKISSNYSRKLKTLRYKENGNQDDDFYSESSDFTSESENEPPSKESGSSVSGSSGKNHSSKINGKCDCICHGNALIERVHNIKRKQLQKIGCPSNTRSCTCCGIKKLGKNCSVWQKTAKDQTTNSKLQQSLKSSLIEDINFDERRICSHNKELAADDRFSKGNRIVASYKSRYANCYRPYQSLKNRLVQCANTYGFHIPIRTAPENMLDLVNSSKFLEERENFARLAVFDELLNYLKNELLISEVTPAMKKEVIARYQRELQALVKLYQAKDESKPSSIKEYDSKLLALKNIISKQYKAAERKNEIQKRLQKHQTVQNQIRNQRILTAKFKRSFDNSQIEIQSQIMKERDKEEQMLQELFGKGLAARKHKLKELQKCTKEMKGLMSSQYKDELKTLENFYIAQIEMLAEGLASEQLELKAKEKAQLKILEQLKKEFQEKLQNLQKVNNGNKLKDQQVHSCCRN